MDMKILQRNHMRRPFNVPNVAGDISTQTNEYMFNITLLKKSRFYQRNRLPQKYKAPMELKAEKIGSQKKQ